MTNIVSQLILQIILIALNAVFAAAEIAIISVNDAKLAAMAAQGNKKAVRLARLTSAPAIGEYLSDLIAEKYGFQKKEDFVSTRKGFIEAAKLPKEERAQLIAEHPEYGRIVCRCENISEGEILDAIRRNPGAKSMDGIKRRVRQGMGRCQAGFCTPKAMDILSRELGISMTSVTKNKPGSELLKAE